MTRSKRRAHGLSTRAASVCRLSQLLSATCSFPATVPACLGLLGIPDFATVEARLPGRPAPDAPAEAPDAPASLVSKAWRLVPRGPSQADPGPAHCGMPLQPAHTHPGPLLGTAPPQAVRAVSRVLAFTRPQSDGECHVRSACSRTLSYAEWSNNKHRTAWVPIQSCGSSRGESWDPRASVSPAVQGDWGQHLARSVAVRTEWEEAGEAPGAGALRGYCSASGSARSAPPAVTEARGWKGIVPTPVPLLPGAPHLRNQQPQE